MAYIISLMFESQPDGWRYMFAFLAVPSTIYGLALLPLPEFATLARCNWPP